MWNWASIRPLCPPLAAALALCAALPVNPATAQEAAIPDREIHEENLERLEPNDSPNQAVAAELEATYRLALYPDGDIDVFKVSAPAKGHLFLTLHGSAAAITPVGFVLRTASGEEAVKYGESNSEFGRDAIFVVESGDYLLEMNLAGPAVKRTFQMSLGFVADNDPGEMKTSFIGLGFKEGSKEDTIFRQLAVDAGGTYFPVDSTSKKLDLVFLTAIAELKQKPLEIPKYFLLKRKHFFEDSISTRRDKAGDVAMTVLLGNTGGYFAMKSTVEARAAALGRLQHRLGGTAPASMPRIMEAVFSLLHEDMVSPKQGEIDYSGQPEQFRQLTERLMLTVKYPGQPDQWRSALILGLRFGPNR